jgi:motility quorum-sensing regulator/GCU-specific mRNA interferase toxin
MLPLDPASRATPTYDLERVQQFVGQGGLSCVITTAAYDGAGEWEWERQEIIEAVLSLAPQHFYKTMEAEKRPGLWQDVYHLPFRGVELYIKLQIDPAGFAAVVQFKRR